MSSANDPSAETGIQTTPTPEAPPIPLPPPRPRLPGVTAEEARRTLDRFDAILVVLVLALAALVSLFPVRNSDFWLHLAVGRGLAGGEFGPAAEPFSYTANGSWVNHSWLYGLGLYAAYKTLGGGALVVLKALLVVALAALMLRLRRRELGLWIPAVCTALAVLAMVPRLLLQPALFSFLFLGVTLYLLTRRERTEALVPDKKKSRTPAPPPWQGDAADRPLWLLVPLFALWVNLDSWFFLGPLAVALSLLGEVVREWTASGGREGPRPGGWRPLAAVLVVGSLACLLSPHHVNALRLPAEIGAGATLAPLQRDDLFRRMLSSSWASEFVEREAKSVAGVAFYVLTALGLLSFVLNFSAGRWGRLFLWAALFALASYHARAIPFFAVVGGPIAALNLQEYAVRAYGAAPRVTGLAWQWSILGRVLTGLACVALLFLAWPGWVLSFTSESRRVGLSAEPDPSLVKLAEALRTLRQDGVLTGNAFNAMPDVTNMLAWLSPPGAPEKGFFDIRFGLYTPEVADEYVKLRYALIGRVTADRPDGVSEEAARLLRERKVSHVLLYEPEGLTEGSVHRLLREPTLCVPLYFDGRTAVFGVAVAPPATPAPNPFVEELRARTGLADLRASLPRQPAEGPFAGRAFDPAVAAFGSAAEPLPAGKPPQPKERAWWEPYARGAGAKAAASDEAGLLLLYFNAVRYDWHYDNVMVPWEAYAASCVAGAWAPSGSPVATGLTGAMQLLAKTQFELPPFDPMEGPVAPALLAARRARQALLANPNEPRTYLWLGQAYRHLRWDTEETRWGVALPQLAMLRQSQLAVAFRNVLQLRPERQVELVAHDALASLYGRLNYRDLEVKHMGERLRLVKEIGPIGGQDPATFAKQAEAMEKQYKQYEKDLKTRQNEYAVKSSGKKVLEKAGTAAQFGLAETALQVLLDSDSLEFGAPGARLQLDLLLSMGDLERLRVMLLSGNEKEDKDLALTLRQQYGGPLYELYRFQLAAAEGDYAEADRFLEEAGRTLVEDPTALANARRAVLSPTALSVAAERDPSAARDFPEAAALDPRQLEAVGVARAIVDALPERGPVFWLYVRRQHRDRLLYDAASLIQPVRQQADFTALRGVLALEAGDVEAARKHFRQALFHGTDSKEPVLDFGGRAASLKYLGMIDAQRK